MLIVAERIEPSVEWCPGTADVLPFLDRSFDAVVSQFGMMFFADRPGAIDAVLMESERALADFVTPDGNVVFESPAHIITGARASRGR